MMADQRAFDLTRRDVYALFTPVTIRFSDTDMLGHVNNVATASYFEAGRCELFYKLMADGGLTERGKQATIDFVLARVAIDYRKEFFYPGTVEVGSRFTRLGNRSITTGYGLFIGDTCHATAESVNVFFDLEQRTSVPPPPGVRKLLEAAIAA
ncbi:MAG: thioesterase family protein [Hyphomicrobiaceae bacterium]|nr:thioesterase family protein [Hyphomicrobiaceae bacterium]